MRSILPVSVDLVRVSDYFPAERHDEKAEAESPPVSEN